MSSAPRPPSRAIASISKPPRSSILWVGPPDALDTLTDEALARAFPSFENLCEVTAVNLSELEARLITGRPTDAVISPLFWRGGDGIETARVLERLNYSHPYRIVTPELPRPDIVLRELRAACPSLDVDLLPFRSLNSG